MNFLKQLLATFISTFFCLIVIPIIALIVFVGILVILVGGSQDEQTTNNKIVYYNLSTPVLEAPQSEDGTFQFFFNKMPSLTSSFSTLDICVAIEDVAIDEDCKVLFIHGKLSPEITITQVEEIRKSIFETSQNKHTIVYLENPTQLEYYLASAAKTIVLNPASDFTFKGMSATPMFLGDAFKKYGINAQVIKSGKHKNFANIFTENKLDETDKRHLLELIDNIWQSVVKNIATTRKLDIKKLKKITEESPLMSAQQALKNGFVDKLMYADEMLERLAAYSGMDVEKFNKTKKTDISFFRPKWFGKDNLALIYMTGDIVEVGEADTISANTYVPLLRNIREDDSIQAVVLRLDTGGGSAYASELIRREVELLAKKKPVIVSMGATCASGGYWISTAATKTFADSTTITGSIGVVSVIFSAEKLANDFGVTFDNVKTSPFADIFNSTRKTSPEALDKIKPLLDNTYDKFVNLVATSRKMKKQDAFAIADGRVYTGAQAKEINLCDELGTLDEALDLAIKLADIGMISIKQYPEIDIFDEIFGYVEDSGIFAKNEATKTIKDAKKLIKAFDSSNKIQAKLPFELNVKY